MPLPDPAPGLVIRYAYLWHRQYLNGQEEGEKDRPCAIILTSRSARGDTLVTVVPVTHAEPEPGLPAVEIPVATSRRLGLDGERSWAIVSEVNRFVWPGPDLRRIPGREDYAYGELPPRLFDRIRQAFLTVARQQRARLVPRSE